jgi:hypothetical protein
MIKVIMTRHDGSEMRADLDSYVRHRLGGLLVEARGGQLETLEARVEALTNCISKIVAQLAEGGLLSPETIFDTLLPANFDVKDVRFEQSPPAADRTSK